MDSKRHHVIYNKDIDNDKQQQRQRREVGVIDGKNKRKMDVSFYFFHFFKFFLLHFSIFFTNIQIQILLVYKIFDLF
jgi:hypothetical protein